MIFIIFISTVTLPILREKVAEAMKLPIEDLLGKEIKSVILETFQEFLLSKHNEESAEEDESELEDKLTTKKPKKDDIEMKKKEDKTESKTKNKTSSKTSSSKSQSPLKSATSTKNSQQIERLKSYVFKCGVRKNWYTFC